MTGYRSEMFARTTFWGGLLLLVGAVLQVPVLAGLRLRIAEGVYFSFTTPTFVAAHLLLLAAAFAVLAVGLPLGRGVSGPSWLSQTGLILFGAQQFLLSVLAGWSEAHDQALLPTQAWVIPAVESVCLVGGFFASIVVSRLGIVSGCARWAPMSLVVCTLLSHVLLAIPDAGVVGWISLSNWLFVVVLAGCGLAFLIEGRWERVSATLRVLREKW